MFAISGATCAALRPALNNANRASGNQRIEVVMDDYSMPFPSSATFLSLLGVQRPGSRYQLIHYTHRMQARVSPLCNARRSSVPSAQHHSLTGVTLGTKNWYGILGRQQAHFTNTFTRALSTSPTLFVPLLLSLIPAACSSATDPPSVISRMCA